MRLSMKLGFIILSLLFLSACGGDTAGSAYDASVATQLPPYASRVNPAAGRAGDTVTVFGFGFSDEAPNNIVTFGAVSASASAYSLVAGGASPDIESLTVTVPAAAPAGACNVHVTVFGNTSNTNVTFTVNP
jgi:hypothetical protein